MNNEDLSNKSEVRNVYEYKLEKGKNSSNGYFQIAISKNEKKVAFVRTNSGIKSSDSEIMVKVFNDDLEQEWELNFKLNSTLEHTKIYSTIISNTGDVYIVTKYFDESLRRKDKSNEFNLLRVRKDGLQVEQKIDFEDKNILNLRLNLDKNRELMCGGIYERNEVNKGGAFFMSYDSENLNAKIKSKRVFDFVSDKLKNIVLKDLIFKEDGGYIW